MRKDTQTDTQTGLCYYNIDTPCFNHPYCHTLTFFFDTLMKSICTEVTHKYPIVSKLKCANKLMKYQMKQGNVLLMIDSVHPIAKCFDFENLIHGIYLNLTCILD